MAFPFPARHHCHSLQAWPGNTSLINHFYISSSQWLRLRVPPCDHTGPAELRAHTGEEKSTSYLEHLLYALHFTGLISIIKTELLYRTHLYSDFADEETQDTSLQDKTPFLKKQTPILCPDPDLFPKLRWKPYLTPDLMQPYLRPTLTDPRPNRKSHLHPAPTCNILCNPVTSVLALAPRLPWPTCVQAPGFISSGGPCWAPGSRQPMPALPKGTP